MKTNVFVVCIYVMINVCIEMEVAMKFAQLQKFHQKTLFSKIEKVRFVTNGQHKNYKSAFKKSVYSLWFNQLHLQPIIHLPQQQNVSDFFPPFNFHSPPIPSHLESKQSELIYLHPTKENPNIAIAVVLWVHSLTK